MKQFYVYTHAKPDGSIFYVGKGHGNRAYQFSKRTVWHKNIVQKYGTANIRIQIVNCESEQAAFDLEKIYIKQLRESGAELVNLTDGGEGTSGMVHTEETRLKMSAAKKGLSTTKMRECQLGKKASDETKQKMTEARKGKTQSEETKQKRRESLRLWHATNPNAGMKGKKHTPESNEKRRATFAETISKKRSDMI